MNDTLATTTSADELMASFLKRLREPTARVHVHTPNPLGDDTSGHDPRIILDHIAELTAWRDRLRVALVEISNLPDSRADECCVIAKRALT